MKASGKMKVTKITKEMEGSEQTLAALHGMATTAKGGGGRLLGVVTVGWNVPYTGTTERPQSRMSWKGEKKGL